MYPMYSTNLLASEEDRATRALATIAALSAVVGYSMGGSQEHHGLAVGGKYHVEELQEAMPVPSQGHLSSAWGMDEGSQQGFESDSFPIKHKTVRFCEKVSVIEIPSYRDMDAEVIQSVWTSTEELEKNRLRNTLEYNWNGRDWTNALEEDQMIYDPYSGSYIHPATWEAMGGGRYIHPGTGGAMMDVEPHHEDDLEDELMDFVLVQEEAKPQEGLQVWMEFERNRKIMTYNGCRQQIRRTSPPRYQSYRWTSPARYQTYYRRTSPLWMMPSRRRKSGGDHQTSPEPPRKPPIRNRSSWCLLPLANGHLST